MTTFPFVSFIFFLSILYFKLFINIFVSIKKRKKVKSKTRPDLQDIIGLTKSQSHCLLSKLINMRFLQKQGNHPGGC
jgi:hypothetical protein